jgi:hypothetical protein
MAARCCAANEWRAGEAVSRQVHPLVTAILLRLARLDPLSAERICDGERIADRSVASAEVSLEIDAPELIGGPALTKGCV